MMLTTIFALFITITVTANTDHDNKNNKQTRDTTFHPSDYLFQIHNTHTIDIKHARVAKIIDDLTKLQINMAVQKKTQTVLAHVVAQHIKANMHHIINIVVDTTQQTITNKHINNKKLLNKLGNLLLNINQPKPTTIRLATTIGHATFEPNKQDPTIKLDPVHIQIIDHEPHHVQLIIIITINTKLKHINTVKHLQPAQLEIPKRENDINIILAHQGRNVHVEQPINENKNPHLHSTQ